MDNMDKTRTSESGLHKFLRVIDTVLTYPGYHRMTKAQRQEWEKDHARPVAAEQVK